MRNIIAKLNEYEIDLILMDISKPGHYLPDCKTLIASNKLDEYELKEVILHELKHIMDHEDYIILYNKSFNIRSKLEYEANDFMISELINDAEGLFNYSNIVSEYNLKMGYEKMLNLKAI